VTDVSEVTVEDPPASGVVLPPPADPAADARAELAGRLVAEAEASGVDLVGPGGLLGELTRVLELGLEVEMSEHLGHKSTLRRAATAGTPQRHRSKR
jgi:hypothetical protein